MVRSERPRVSPHHLYVLSLKPCIYHYCLFFLGLESDEQSIIVVLDLSLLNPKLNDISYESIYKRQNLIVDHNIELQLSKDSKLKSHAFVHETSAGKFKYLLMAVFFSSGSWDLTIIIIVNDTRDGPIFFITGSLGSTKLE